MKQANHKKQLVLTTKLLREINYPDLNVAFREATGFPLVGDMEQVEVFEGRPYNEVVKGADPTWLARTARVARANLIEKVKQTPVDDTLRAIYDITTNERDGEVANGWAVGPLSEEEVSKIITDDMDSCQALRRGARIQNR